MSTDKLAILGQISERARALEPEQPHRDGTGRPADQPLHQWEHRLLADLRAAGMDTWRDELLDRTYGAFAQTAWPELRQQLVDIAAAVVNWIGDGDRREPSPDHKEET